VKCENHSEFFRGLSLVRALNRVIGQQGTFALLGGVHPGGVRKVGIEHTKGPGFGSFFLTDVPSSGFTIAKLG
jgi:hypothetical protein